MKRQLLHNALMGIAALFASIALPAMAQAQSTEGYAVMNVADKSMTFYYDANKATHTEGTVYDFPDSNTGYPEWCLVYNRKIITTVTFDNSMADCHPTTTRMWFDGFEELTTINNIENLNTDKVTNMGGMFSGCKALKQLDVSAFKTQDVTFMDYMFDNCELLTELDVSGFDTQKVTKMSFMFYNCKGLTTLDVSSFNTEAVEDVSDMFHDCESLTTIYCDETWTTEMSINMFKNCKNIKGGTDGTVTYDDERIDIMMANPTTGYFTKKKSIAIDTPVAENKAKTAYKGIYTLEGMRLGNDFDRLPASIYIVNGEKVMKQ